MDCRIPAVRGEDGGKGICAGGRSVSRRRLHHAGDAVVDGRAFRIDRVLEVRRAASLKAGGVGWRYKCRIQGRERYLFYEDPAWFVETDRGTKGTDSSP